MGLTFFSCPHCVESLGTRSGIRSNLEEIGSSWMQCPKCGAAINTGAQEWVDMHFTDKLKVWAEVYLYYGVLIGPSFAFMAWAGVTEYLHQSNLIGILAGVVAWALIMLRVHCVHKKKVADSLKRRSE
ncbi:MAG: hypothetical protein C4562_04695 [Actinobacteria bacterium]|nr:MAG: hypothetical protein C4562_04695 [Actinomycetota bacterium]